MPTTSTLERLVEHAKKKLSLIVAGSESIEEAFNRIEFLCTSITDSEGLFTDVSAAYCNLLGYTKEELIGRHFRLVLPKHLRIVCAQLHQEFVHGKQEVPNTYTVQHKDGHLLRVNLEAVRITDAEGTTVKMSIIEPLYWPNN
jgi:PAS domain S-box-containing protein